MKCLKKHNNKEFGLNEIYQNVSMNISLSISCCRIKWKTYIYILYVGTISIKVVKNFNVSTIF